ncbi:MAG: hypothetical protein F4Y20_13130 [Acidobacteria bacterium]|nr:hypothetical protein [Acidobacteriota bacterium]
MRRTVAENVEPVSILRGQEPHVRVGVGAVGEIHFPTVHGGGDGRGRGHSGKRRSRRELHFAPVGEAQSDG